MLFRRFLYVLTALLNGFVYSYYIDPIPIQFSIPENKIISTIPEKSQDFASLIPGDLSTYIYTNEKEYYKGYQQSYFAFTWKKGGWDCLRHYEIIANGCIPYFVDLDLCDPNIMTFLPKELILEAMHLKGVSYGAIDHSVFDRNRYYEILSELLGHLQKHLTTKKMAQYILDKIGYSGQGTILYLSHDPSPDYLRCLTLVGLKEVLGEKVVDFPKIEHIYTNYVGESRLYGKGFSYTKIVPDLPINRSNIEERIRKKEFDFIIYGSVHRGLPFHRIVSKKYNTDQIFYLCGEDAHNCQYKNWPNLFLREYTK